MRSFTILIALGFLVPSSVYAAQPFNIERIIESARAHGTVIETNVSASVRSESTGSASARVESQVQANEGVRVRVETSENGVVTVHEASGDGKDVELHVSTSTPQVQATVSVRARASTSTQAVLAASSSVPLSTEINRPSTLVQVFVWLASWFAWKIW